MTENRQAVADAPLQIGRMRNAMSVFRYLARSAAYSNEAIRSLLEGGRTTSENTAAYWDRLMSQTRFSTYLGGTIGVNSSNALTAILIKYRAPPEPSVLDVGCCGGTLVTSLSSFSRYFGTDVSAHAIGVARSDPELAPYIAAGRVAFEAADLRSFEPEGVWDVIVFNEVLYYLRTEQAVAQVDRFAKHLAPGGVLCISMKDDPKSKVIFSKLFLRYKWIDGLLYQRKTAGPSYHIAINREGPGFLLGVLRPLR